ncbi:MAG: DUF72 domain-containing protein [Gaiellales bacterium]|nr:MAG: DUF72 domain-containing protein [Gaiellales bacterium]
MSGSGGAGAGRALVGTSGWNYGHWRHCFYPPEVKQPGWLEYYSRFLATVEINATFYRLPEPEHVRRWHDAVPEGFIFAVKGSRYLTHMKRLGDHGEPLDRFMDMAALLGDKCGPVLWQLPPQMKRDDDRLAAFAGALPGGFRHAFEFRDPVWYCQEVYDILDNAGCALCIPDHPERPGEQVLTVPWTYIRLHHSGKEGLYSAEDIKRWAATIADFVSDGIDVYAYFNNDQKGYGIRNALELRELVG